MSLGRSLKPQNFFFHFLRWVAMAQISIGVPCLTPNRHCSTGCSKPSSPNANTTCCCTAMRHTIPCCTPMRHTTPCCVAMQHTTALFMIGELCAAPSMYTCLHACLHMPPHPCICTCVHGCVWRLTGTSFWTQARVADIVSDISEENAAELVASGHSCGLMV